MCVFVCVCECVCVCEFVCVCVCVNVCVCVCVNVCVCFPLLVSLPLSQEREGERDVGSHTTITGDHTHCFLGE